MKPILTQPGAAATTLRSISAADGAIWWQLDNNLYVCADVVNEIGACYALELRSTPFATLTPFSSPTALATAAWGNIGYGDTITALRVGELGEYFVFNGEQGDMITITMTSRDFDSYIELYSPDSILIAASNNIGMTLNAQIAGLSLPRAGTYVIYATAPPAS